MTNKIKTFAMILIGVLLSINKVWAETYTMYNGSSINSSWTKSNNNRSALVTYASQYSVQLMGVNSGNYGEVYSNITFTGITAISINATASNAQTLTVYYKTTAANAEWTQLSTKSISKNSTSYSNYDITITGIPSSAVYIKFRSGGNSIYIRTVTITTGSSYTLTFLEHVGGGTASGSPSTGTVSANATSFSFGATAPSKTGYTIEGFYSDTYANSGIKVADGSRNFLASKTGWTNSSSQYTKGENANLYIKWQANVYTVSTDFTNISVSSAFPSSFTYTGSTTTDLNRTLSVTSSYALPSDLTVTMGGNACTKGAEYSYNSSTGAFSFDVAITGDISISGSAIPYRTITFNDNGNTTVETWLQGSSHATPTITGCTEYTPLGWTTTAPTSNAWASQPSYTAGGNNITVPSSNTTYYAVYTTGTPSIDYVRTSSITSGANYVITYAGQKALDASEYYYDDDNTPADYFFGTADVSESSSTISNPGANLIWRITGDNTNGYEIYNANQDRYLGFDADDNEMYLYYDSHTDYTITFSSQNCYIQPKADDEYYFYEKRFGTSGSYSYWFDIYTSSGYNILFKQSVTTSYISNPACCDAPTALTKGSINASSQTVSWTAPASAPSGGYYVAYSTATSSDPGNDVYSTSGNYTVMAISAGTTTANIPCNTAGTYNWWVRSKCSSSDNTSCSGWVKGTAWTMKTIYLNTNYDWNAGGAKFAVHYWNDDTPTPKSGWSKLMTEQTDCYGGIYKVLVPDGYNNINFGRFSTAQITDPTDWTNRWNQTSNLTIPTNPAKDYFTLTSKTGDNDYNGTWGNYTQSFQINFDLNKGGETFTTEPATAPAARCVASGSTTSAPTNPQAMGWEITGWYKESGKTHEWVFASQTVSEDQTLYAKWETVANKTIYLDASKVLSGSKNWDTDDVVLFAHAYINGTNLATDVKMTTALSSCDDHIYAFDIPGNADYVTFVRCASGASSIIWSGGSGNVYNQFSLAVEENKDWYYVDDWNAGTLKSTEFSPTTYSMSFATGSTTYTGGNAISGSKDSEGKACDVDYTLPGSAVFSTTGYTQTSWATEDGGSKAYDFGDDYKDNADQAFYPVWTINSHTLTWNWGGGSTSSDSYTAGGTVNYGATITYPADNTMSKTGYDFSSWSTDATTMPDNDLTITASWTIHTHKVSVTSVSNATITATPAGASAIAEGSNNGSVNYGTTVTLNWPTPDTHYSNITWDVYKDGDSSTKVAVSGSGNGATFTLPDYDVVVSATAVEDAYKTVCFKNNGVGITGYTAQKVYVGSRPTAPTLTDGTDHDACDETSDTHYGWTQTAWQNTLEQAAIDAKTEADVKVYAKDATLPAITAGDDGTTITYHAVWTEAISVPSSEYQLVTNTNQLLIGDKVVIGSAASGSIYLLGKDSVTAANYEYRKFAQSGTFSVSNSKVTVSTLASSKTDRNNPFELTLGKSGDYWTFYDGVTGGYVCCTSTSTMNRCGYEAELSDAGKWDISITSSLASIVSQISSDITTRNYLQKNGTDLSGIFSCYPNSQTNPAIFRNLSTTGYQNFLTTCCTQYEISGASTSGTAVTGGTLTSTDNSACEDREVKITANVSDGYRFDSWTITAGGSPVARKDGTAEIEDGKPIYVFDMPAADVTVSAAFTRVYTVTYDANGGTGEMIDVNSPYAAGDKVTVLTNIFTKAGYDFDSWSYSPAVSVTDGKFDMPSSDVTITAQWTAKPLNNIILAQTEAVIYDKQYVQIEVSYDPADIVTKGYTLTGPALTKVVTTGSTQTQLKISATKAGVIIGEVVSETVSIKANADETKTASVTVTIKPLPLVHFVDIIHSIEFGDVVEEIVDNALSGTKTTPTHSDVSDPGVNYNSCERGHLHLLGWIESTWADAHPGATSAAITGAGSGKYYEAGASINVEDQNGKTFYAVWCVIE